jgi:hypothetical protein
MVFVCKHESAKSMIALQHFERLAEKEGIPSLAYREAPGLAKCASRLHSGVFQSRGIK